jgi:hypothetical protein
MRHHLDWKTMMWRKVKRAQNQHISSFPNKTFVFCLSEFFSRSNLNIQKLHVHFIGLALYMTGD